jgi:hypothetical protein
LLRLLEILTFIIFSGCLLSKYLTRSPASIISIILSFDSFCVSNSRTSSEISIQRPPNSGGREVSRLNSAGKVVDAFGLYKSSNICACRIAAMLNHENKNTNYNSLKQQDIQ